MQTKLSALAVALLWSVAVLHAQVNMEQYANIPPAELVKKKELSEKDLEGIARYFRVQQKNEQKAAELEALLIQQNPKGPLARLAAFQRAARTREPEARIIATEAFLKEFPQSEWNHNPRNQEFIYYSLYRVLGTDYFESRKFDKLLGIRSQLNFKQENEIFRWNVMRAYTFKMLRYDSLYEVATPMIKDLVAKVNDGSYLEAGVFTAETAAENARQQLDNQLTVYIKLLNSLEKYTEAYTFFGFLSPKGRYGIAELNDIQLA
ncbi:MAG: hypothetical protein JST39_16350, partial [Bacteroidetes bacterium]|nr:hypothetical protein [Bacteroidota bacterium]